MQRRRRHTRAASPSPPLARAAPPSRGREGAPPPPRPMKSFSKKKDRATFDVHVVDVAPWPVTSGSDVCVGWRRGGRRGAAAPLGAPVGADGLHLGARFSVPATLYRV